jgi:hypothetical protein
MLFLPSKLRISTAKRTHHLSGDANRCYIPACAWSLAPHVRGYAPVRPPRYPARVEVGPQCPPRGLTLFRNGREHDVLSMGCASARGFPFPARLTPVTRVAALVGAGVSYPRRV